MDVKWAPGKKLLDDPDAAMGRNELGRPPLRGWKVPFEDRLCQEAPCIRALATGDRDLLEVLAPSTRLDFPTIWQG
jgi:hypothetical protein